MEKKAKNQNEYLLARPKGDICETGTADNSGIAAKSTSVAILHVNLQTPGL